MKEKSLAEGVERVFVTLGKIIKRGGRGSKSERMAGMRVKMVNLPSLDSGIQLPWDIRSSENKYSRIVVTNTVDLSSAPLI